MTVMTLFHAEKYYYLMSERVNTKRLCSSVRQFLIKVHSYLYASSGY